MCIDEYLMATNNVPREIGKRLRVYRISQGIKQTELSQKMGISRSTIARAERGENVSFWSMTRILRGLGLMNYMNLLVPEYEYNSVYVPEKKTKNKRTSAK